MFFFRISISCCEKCPAKLKKGLLKVNGVYSVFMEPESNLVIVVGKVDPNLIIHTVAKMGKKAELVSHNEKDHYSDGTNNRSSDEKVPDCVPETRNPAQQTKNHELEQGNRNQRSEPHVSTPGSTSGHNVEDYVPPPRWTCGGDGWGTRRYDHVMEDYVLPPPMNYDHGIEDCWDANCLIHNGNRIFDGGLFPPTRPWLYYPWGRRFPPFHPRHLHPSEPPPRHFTGLVQPFQFFRR